MVCEGKVVVAAVMLEVGVVMDVLGDGEDKCREPGREMADWGRGLCVDKVDTVGRCCKYTGITNNIIIHLQICKSWWSRWQSQGTCALSRHWEPVQANSCTTG